MRFSLRASSTDAITRVELEFGAEKVYSCATSDYSSVRLDFDRSPQVELSWDWQLKKTGSIPPGSDVWWRWRFEDGKGRSFVSARKSVPWEDQRFQWDRFVHDNLVLYWYDGGDGFGEELGRDVIEGLGRLDLGTDLVKPIEAFIYGDARSARESILFAPEWAGGIAFTDYNTLVITVPPDDVETYRRGLVHELAHLLVQEVSFNCFWDMPTWLNEGLASYSEGPLAGFLAEELDLAIRSRGLISVRSLSSNFPADRTHALRSYAQSNSIVTYLIEEHGWQKMRELLALFGEGSTADDALRRVYGLDTEELDGLWKEYVGAR